MQASDLAPIYALASGNTPLGMGNPVDLGGITPSSSMGGGGGFLSGLGVNDIKLAMSGLQTIGQLWGAFQSANLAKKQFNFTKDMTETNLANSIRAYNTSLEDKARSRGVVEGQSAAQIADYIARNAARRGG